MSKEKLIKFLEKNADITFKYEPEYETFIGNCSAIDKETDKRQEAWIQSELDSGNMFAWFYAICTARYRNFSSWDSLGCCSYKSQEDFEKDDYYTDMKAQAIDNLADTIIDQYNELNELEPLIES